MAISIKFTKFDNTPWGFRLAGGSDFPQPLTVIRVTEGSLAECMGLKIGDVIVRLNDQPISSLTHGQAHEELMHAGNNFILAIQREEETRKAAEAISEENIVPYKIALADLPPVFPEEILKEETVIERYEEEKTVDEHTAPLSAEEELRREEEKLAEEKPVDANSEIVPNKNLTDDEIAQLILEEEELLSDQGLLGVNFKKLRPRAPILKDSKVLEELQNIATAEPERVQELKRTSTFLQKPQRPVPKLKCEQKVEEDDCETYKVVIKKQDKKTVIARLVEKGLLPPGSEATLARTPEPPELSEVKMHETENSLEADRSPVVSDLNSSCSTIPLHSADDLPPSEFDSNGIHPAEDQSMRCATTYKCKPKLKPGHYQRCSSAGKYNEVRARLPIKGHYLENVLRGYARSCIARDRQIDDQFDEFAMSQSGSAHFKKHGLPSGITTKRTSRCARAHYVERILLRNVSAVARQLRLKSKTTRVVASRTKRARTKGRYLATYLRRESTRLMSLMTTLFQFLLQRPDVPESANMLEARKRRMSFKGRYLEQVLQKNVTPVLQCVKETCLVNDEKTIGERKNGPKSTRTKGRYMEKYLYKQNLRLRFALTNLLDHAKSSLDNLLVVATSSKAKRAMRGRYFERVVRRNLEILELFVEYVRSGISKWLKENPSCTSRTEFPIIAVSASDLIADNAVLNKQKNDEEFYDAIISDWYEDSPSCPLQKESPVIANAENLISNEEETDENDSNVAKCTDNSVLSEEADKISNSSKPTDTILEEEDNFSKFLQSTENYISAEVFHRGSRRLSKSRKSIDILPKEDDDGFSKFLQSAEDYVSTEVFHRGSRRLSKSRKSIDILPKEDDGDFSKFLQSAEDYVSAEVFHRGSRRLSKSYKDAGQEQGALSNILRSTGDYVSSEIFHRKSRRLSISSRKESVSLVTPTSGKSMYFNLPWFSFKVSENSTEYSGGCEEKIDSEIERDSRRLSFVPTILYQGVTNCIGVDFTRLVAYAFVPCTSIILLYMYK
nr:PREDICTED: uncharacterized protein LOC105668449 isoform X1 [Linepithema humile]XP_012216266.1 PREDICTED: uncharacterized protein LOC105668449 isoform X1 [Linepithema humile]